MRDFLYRFRLLLLLVVLVVLGVLTWVGNTRSPATGERRGSAWSSALLELAVPVQRAVTAPVGYVRGLFDRYVALVGVRERNESLQHDIDLLRDENLKLREALLATERLDAIAETQESVGLPMLPAEVAGLGPSLWYQSVLLDRGTRQGVEPGMPTVTDAGIVGLVTASSPNAAKAMLLLDRQSAVDGLVERNRARGIVRGQGTGELVFEYDAREPDVQVGDVLITSGLGGVYPRGLRIGEIVALSPAGSGLLAQARVRPAVDFGRLEQVYVVLWRSPALELLNQDPEMGYAPKPPSVSAAPR
ncbi:MAG TPA: rod shape-determining protein MreC [Myxococcota bacterium]|jgi:rod shape-determining protein MreC|nr:rod shape-determining protein MreC [Myxococcota bacterium]